MSEAYGRFAEVYDRLMRQVDYDGWADYIARLIRSRLRSGPSGQRLHECACGTGQITRRLAGRGFGVTASDLSPGMLNLAQRNAYDAGLRIPFVRQDMRKLELHRPVDAVVCACDGVNYLDSSEALSAFFASAAEALRPGGVLLFDVSTEYKLAEVLGGNCFCEHARDCAYLWSNVYDPVSRLAELQLTFFVQSGALYERFDETHIQRAHAPEELRERLAANGFDRIAAYDAFTESPPRAASERVQWVAEKREA